ncbi:MAG: DUF1003 domain-containing protein [Steroidobacteraceae bacterium]|jgi:uncharacterized membrane protein
MSRVTDQSRIESDSSLAPTPEALIHQNIGDIAEFQEREQRKVGQSQRRLEALSAFLGRPLYLLSLLSLVIIWIGGNTILILLGERALDPPPFSWLQGFLTLAALVTTTVVLIAQNRQTKLETQHAHLDLQVNLLTEQKVSKIIDLLEELRRDLPMVRNRHDPEAAALQQRTDTAQVLSALANVGVGDTAQAAPDAQQAAAER